MATQPLTCQAPSPCPLPQGEGNKEGVLLEKGKKNVSFNRINTILFYVLLFVVSTVSAQTIMKPAKRHLYLLVHGEDAQGKSNSYRVFTSDHDGEIRETDKYSENPGNAGLKGFLEKRYNLEGHIYAYQFDDPSAPLNVLTEEFAGWFEKAREDWKVWYHQENPGVAEADLEKMCPRNFIIVAHSAGGLVVRSYLTDLGLYHSEYPVKLLITVNTPHEGTPYTEVLQVLEGRNVKTRLVGIAKESLQESSSEMVTDISSYYKNINAVLGIYNSSKDLVKALQYMKTNLVSRVDALQQQGRAIADELGQTGAAIPSIATQVISKSGNINNVSAAGEAQNSSDLFTAGKKDLLETWLGLEDAKTFLQTRAASATDDYWNRYDQFAAGLAADLITSNSAIFKMMINVQEMQNTLAEISRSSTAINITGVDGLDDNITNIKNKLGLTRIQNIVDKVSALSAMDINTGTVMQAAGDIIAIKSDVQQFLNNASDPEMKIQEVKTELSSLINKLLPRQLNMVTTV